MICLKARNRLMRWHRIYVAILGVVVLSLNIRAQTVSAKEVRLPVTVAVVPQLPAKYAQYTAVVIRSSRAETGDIVLLPRSSATGTLLVQATRALINARAIDGERPVTIHGKPYDTSVLGVRASTNPPLLTSAELSAAQRVVSLLLNSQTPRRSIPSVGEVPAVDIFPPRTPHLTP